MQRHLATLQACAPVSSGSQKDSTLTTAPLISRLPPHAFTQQLGVRSAYHEACGSEPQFTNLTDNYEGCLDYVWFTKGLKVCGVLGLPPAEQIKKYGGAPNMDFPSDHLPLVTAFAFQ
eukprot:GDKI01018922.1.p2 GENE.GDKI01018922.1~~GDKI01018922.1.p2  ORF type:complete len:118 (+),score=40.82 GDKI01018922.1:1-354(+)